MERDSSLFTALNDEPTRQLVDALLTKPQVTIRRRWALLQAELWQEQGWLVAATEGFSLTPAGRQQLQLARQEWQLLQQPDAEGRLQQLDIKLPSRLHRQTAAAWLKGSRHYRWQADEVQQLANDGIQLVRESLLCLRGKVGFSLFFSEGGLLDAGAWLQRCGECILPEQAVMQLNKILWAGKPPQRIFTVESRAAFVSLPLQEDELALLVPPGLADLAWQFLQCLTPGWQWCHVADLHPQRVLSIRAWAQQCARPLALWVPADLAPVAARFGQPLSAEGGRWQLDGLSRTMQAQLTPLIDRQCWIEQEIIALLPCQPVSVL